MKQLPKVIESDLTKLPEKEWNAIVSREKKRIDRATISMWHCAESSRMPPSHSINAFGIESIEHVLAIKWAIENRLMTPFQLDDVRKSGKKITELIVTDKNPFKIVFQTLWDIA